MISTHLTNLNERVEGALWKKGFPQGLTRDAVKVSILIALLLIIVGTIFLPVSTKLFWGGFGAVLAAWNFYSLSHFILRRLPQASREDAEKAPANLFSRGSSFDQI